MVDGWKKILKFAWPLIVANSFWNLQLTIDRIFLGNYSTEALAAAMAVTGVFWTPMALLQQTAAYLSTFVAQYFGAKQEDKIGAAVWQSLYVCVIGGLLFLFLIPLSDFIFELFGHEPSLRNLEKEYFIAITFSALPAALVAAVGAFYTGLGDSKVIMWTNAIGMVANIIFDYIMIFGKFGFPALGIAGAGYATALANWCSAIFALYLMFHHKDKRQFRFNIDWKYNFKLMKQFIKYGLPSGLQFALEGLAFTVFLIFVGRMQNGSAALAASSIAVTIMMLAILPAFGVAQAVTVLVGQHIGEKRPEMAVKDTWSGWQVATIYIVTMAVTFVLFPQFYISWFSNSSDPNMWQQVQEMVPYILMLMSFFICFDSTNLVISFALKGAGDTRFVSLVALTLPWPLMVLPTWYVSTYENGVYLAWAAASVFIVTQAFVFLYRFRQGKWKSMSVINN